MYVCMYQLMDMDEWTVDTTFSNPAGRRYQFGVLQELYKVPGKIQYIRELVNYHNGCNNRLLSMILRVSY